MGTTTYRTVDEQGNVTYSDWPPSGVVYTYDHDTVIKAIKIVRKHVPKTPGYLEYLDHLRHYDAIKFNKALRALQGVDRDVYVKVLAISREHYSLKGALEPAVTGRAFTASHVSKGTIVTG
ncbi:hypothetical protein AGMMS49545_18460 [Betaproteobacteria bacterium]|nr:hypothetical protein AGMMS49545_18460 [Betaproteobacteria bacterium]GHU47550.1 hypothetical protein AGMMS50289_22910 [Betaproteobacteria bacterium]